ncbi:MAG: hypothetical protein HPY53_04815 [Brevinematales bacterium]|nr:hypothetical protein [Brevinematales bacterium]
MTSANTKKDSPQIMKRTGRLVLLDKLTGKPFEVKDPDICEKLLSKDNGRYLRA